MRLVSRDISPSPDHEAATRVTVRVEMESQDRELCFWFDIPAKYESEISQTGNPWLVMMVPLAMHSGEDIKLPYAVDAHLLDNVQGLMRFWADNFPELRSAHIEAPILKGAPDREGKSGLFFSGGVDSTFSLLQHDNQSIGAGSESADDLIFVAGFDIPVVDRSEIELAKSHLERVASAHERTLVTFATNLRQLETPYATRWILSYGCALGTVGHLLEGRYRELIVSAAHTYSDSPITGSHPITDPLLSSRHLRFVHDGATFNRVEKTQRIAEMGSTLSALRVCWEGERHDNCSRCRKCLLTMVTLDLAGFKYRASCFDWSAYDIEEIRRQFLDTDVQITFFREILADARRRGRNDVAKAAAHAIDYSLTIRRIVDWSRRIPVLWRFDFQIERFLVQWAGLTGQRSSNWSFTSRLIGRREAKRWYF